jgi:hypothetical protein
VIGYAYTAQGVMMHAVVLDENGDVARSVCGFAPAIGGWRRPATRRPAASHWAACACPRCLELVTIAVETR